MVKKLNWITIVQNILRLVVDFYIGKHFYSLTCISIYYLERILCDLIYDVEN